MAFGKHFFDVYKSETFKRVLDIGSANVNGSLRNVCPPHLDYLGVDLQDGGGVDLVLDDPYQYPFPNDFFDMIVSTSCFEHDSMFWLTFLEALRVLAPGGLLYINAPSNGLYHAHPVDNWRFFPDAAMSLAVWARRSGVEVELLESFTGAREPNGLWNDYIMVFRKPDGQPPPSDRICHHVTGIANARLLGHEGVINRADLTADMELIEVQRQTIQHLREQTREAQVS
jgi:SAM-dependent methyltransferase